MKNTEMFTIEVSHLEDRNCAGFKYNYSSLYVFDKEDIIDIHQQFYFDDDIDDVVLYYSIVFKGDVQVKYRLFERLLEDLEYYKFNGKFEYEYNTANPVEEGTAELNITIASKGKDYVELMMDRARDDQDNLSMQFNLLEKED